MVVNMPCINECLKSVWIFQKHEKAQNSEFELKV